MSMAFIGLDLSTLLMSMACIALALDDGRPVLGAIDR